jgi:hypothetical protein
MALVTSLFPDVMRQTGMKPEDVPTIDGPDLRANLDAVRGFFSVWYDMHGPNMSVQEAAHSVDWAASKVTVPEGREAPVLELSLRVNPYTGKLPDPVAVRDTIRRVARSYPETRQWADAIEVPPQFPPAQSGAGVAARADRGDVGVAAPSHRSSDWINSIGRKAVRPADEAQSSGTGGTVAAATVLDGVAAHITSGGFAVNKQATLPGVFHPEYLRISDESGRPLGKLHVRVRDSAIVLAASSAPPELEAAVRAFAEKQSVSCEVR